MRASIRHCCAVLLLLAPLGLFAGQSCPELDSISRISGEYGWLSTDGRWEGYFSFPLTGRGDSDQVKQFVEARWIRLTDLVKSKGMIECDYEGNMPGEIIRFVSNISAATDKPTDAAWNCTFSPETPGIECLCASEPGNCRF